MYSVVFGSCRLCVVLCCWFVDVVAASMAFVNLVVVYFVLSLWCFNMLSLLSRCWWCVVVVLGVVALTVLWRVCRFWLLLLSLLDLLLLMCC